MTYSTPFKELLVAPDKRGATLGKLCGSVLVLLALIMPAELFGQKGSSNELQEVSTSIDELKRTANDAPEKRHQFRLRGVVLAKLRGQNVLFLAQESSAIAIEGQKIVSSLVAGQEVVVEGVTHKAVVIDGVTSGGAVWLQRREPYFIGRT